MKRYLNESDVAHILRLFCQARKIGCCRRVFFFGKEKTTTDIASHIRRSSSVFPEPDLSNDENAAIPWYITYEDLPPAQSPIPSIARPALYSQDSNPPSSGSLEPMGSSPIPHVNTSQASVTSYQHSPSWELINSNDYASTHPSPLLSAVASAPDEDAEMPSYDNLFPAGNLPDTRTKAKDMQAVVLSEEQVGLGNAFNLFQPFLHPSPDHSTAPTSPYFHSLLSATPNQRLLDSTTGHLSWELSDVLRKVLEDNNRCEDFSQDRDTASFFINCIRGCILRNQNQIIEAEGRFAAAAADFEKIFIRQTQSSLTVIGSILALLESYGQRMAAREILVQIYQTFQQDSKEVKPFVDTLLFMYQTQVPEYGSKGSYDMHTLEDVYEKFRSAYGPHSRLTLTARYNIAWAQLEHEQFKIARDCLLQLKPLCEDAFGPHHLQSIMVTSTLARAHLYNDEHAPAQMLIKETVVCRVRDIFSESHPYYWEAVFRQATFMKMSGIKERNPTVRRSLMERAEALLRNVLKWRLTILGTANPRTNSTFRVLKNLLEIQGKSNEAYNLYFWAVKECQSQRDQLWQPDFLLS